MIETLRIENLAIVQSEEIEFGPGLNVLTGETGAGKSIVLGALSLLAGSRASPQVVREGCDEAVVEACARSLTHLGFSVDTATTERDCVRHLCEFAPEVLVLEPDTEYHPSPGPDQPLDARSSQFAQALG